MSRRARLLRTEKQHPFFNMALDEVVAPDPPTIRFYSFEPPGLSLGYFQRFASLDAALIERLRLVPVRRVTGGAAICHAGDLTFSIVARPADPLFAGTVEESYDRIHAAIASALAGLGVTAGRRGAGSVRSDSARGDEAICFYKATRFDLIADGSKLVGSAQRRTRERVLHHGSIPLAPNRLAPDAADLESLTGRAVGFDECAAALARAFATHFDLEWITGTVTAAERAAAQREVAERFATDAWNRKR
jgi:lipoyl(octanoyl) transferase